MHKLLRVTVDKLLIRERPTVRSKALLIVDWGTFLPDPGIANSTAETIGSVKSHGMPVGIGYVFGGFVESTSVNMISIHGDYKIIGEKIDCFSGANVFIFSSVTMIFGERNV